MATGPEQSALEGWFIKILCLDPSQHNHRVFPREGLVRLGPYDRASEYEAL